MASSTWGESSFKMKVGVRTTPPAGTPMVPSADTGATAERDTGATAGPTRRCRRVWLRRGRRRVTPTAPPVSRTPMPPPGSKTPVPIIRRSSASSHRTPAPVVVPPGGGATARTLVIGGLCMIAFSCGVMCTIAVDRFWPRAHAQCVGVEPAASPPHRRPARPGPRGGGRAGPRSAATMAVTPLPLAGPASAALATSPTPTDDGSRRSGAGSSSRRRPPSSPRRARRGAVSPGFNRRRGAPWSANVRGSSPGRYDVAHRTVGRPVRRVTAGLRPDQAKPLPAR